jgi:hypothetical protein
MLNQKALVFLPLCISCYGYSVTNNEAFEDLTFVMKKIEELHCSAVKKLPLEVILRFNEEVGKIKRSQKSVKVWRAINRILRELEDANCKIFPKKAFQKRLYERFEMFGGAIYIVKGYRRFNIITINGLSTSVIFDKARHIIPYENVHGLYATFAKTLPYKHFLHLYGAKSKKLCRYEYLKEGRRKKIEVPFIDEPSKSTEVEKYIYFDLFTQSKAAILTIKKCVFNQETQRILHNFFTDIKAKEIQNIAINLIDNPGGSSLLAKEFVRYLPTNEKYQNYKVFIRQENKMVPYIPKTNISESKYDDLIFKGNVYVLTAGTTLNAAARFSVLLQDNKLAKVIGEPCGSKPSNYGHCLYFELPNTKMCFVVTSKMYQRPDPSKDKIPFQKPDRFVPWFQAAEYFVKTVGG